MVREEFTVFFHNIKKITHNYIHLTDIFNYLSLLQLKIFIVFMTFTKLSENKI